MRIVFASDGSSGSKLAQAVLQKLPIASRTRVTVVSVVHSPASVEVGALIRLPAYPSSAGIESWREDRENARRLIDEIAEDLNLSGFVADGLVLEGDTADQILRVVSDEGASLIACGSGESSDFASFFLGSVSRKLALNAESSILIGRGYQGMSQQDSVQRLKGKSKLDLIVAVDGSIGSEIAIDTLSALRQPVFGTVTFVAVEPISDQADEERFDHRVPVLEPNSGWAEEIGRRAVHGTHLCAERVEWEIGFGRPSVEIGRFAGSKKADLVVLSANSHPALERWLIGSCAYEVATSAPCSVLLLRDRLILEEGQNG